jgi:LysR family pca operon transcriptional activator
MAKAATDLSVTAPAVSKVISEMERLLGVRLLDRMPQGVTPTIYGEALVNGAVTLFDELRQTVRKIDFLADPTVGELRIGTTDSPMGGLLPVVLGGLARTHPRLVFDVTLGNSTQDLSNKLRARSIDVFLSRLRPEPEEDFDQEVLFEDPLVVITSKQNRRFRGRAIKMAELMDESWCLPHEENMIGKIMREAFRANGLPLPKICVTCASTQLQTALVERSNFFTMVPSLFLRFRTKSDLLRPVAVDLHINPPPMGVARLKHRTGNPVAEIFIQRVREVVRGAAR